MSLPEGWTVAKLASLATKVGSGATPRGGSDSYLAAGVPLIRSMNVRFEGFAYDGLAFLSDAQAKELPEVEAGDVLLNITGASIGRVTQAPEELAGARVNQHVFIIRPGQHCNSVYLCRYLSCPQVQEMIWSEQYGVTRQALTKSQILDFDIPSRPSPNNTALSPSSNSYWPKFSPANSDSIGYPRCLNVFGSLCLLRHARGG